MAEANFPLGIGTLKFKQIFGHSETIVLALDSIDIGNEREPNLAKNKMQ